MFECICDLSRFEKVFFLHSGYNKIKCFDDLNLSLVINIPEEISGPRQIHFLKPTQ